ncbi:MAG: hypothetical protein HY537_08395 [Deltaproteobacteria bacterium]|nr:hypothetical protein [Deltaproteobacteria bacterium]
MKQGLRLFLRPGTFFGQLQWSPHHWFILLAFLVIATVETHLGKYTDAYQNYTLVLQTRLGISFDTALWVIIFTKLFVMLGGTYLIANFVWFVGNQIGMRKSKRVLFRRLAIVFAVLLAGYTSQQLLDYSPHFLLAAVLLYSWGLFLGYFAIREQFELNMVETTIVALFSILLVTSAWHYSHHAVEAMAQAEASAIARPHIEKNIHPF